MLSKIQVAVSWSGHPPTAECVTKPTVSLELAAAYPCHSAATKGEDKGQDPAWAHKAQGNSTGCLC